MLQGFLREGIKGMSLPNVFFIHVHWRWTVFIERPFEPCTLLKQARHDHNTARSLTVATKSIEAHLMLVTMAVGEE